MKLLIPLLFFLLFTKINFVFSQNLNQEKIDSIYSELNEQKPLKERGTLYYELSSLYADYYPDSTIKYGYKSLKILDGAKGEETKVLDLNYHLGVAYLDINLEKAKFYIKRSLNQSIESDNDRFKSLNYLAYSSYFSRIPDLDSSTSYLVKATKYFLEINDSIPLAYCYYGIMSNYNGSGNIQRTIDYGERTLRILKPLEIDHLIGRTTIALAHSYFKSGENNLKAERYVLEAKKIANRNKDKPLLLEVYLTTGIHNYESGDYIPSIRDYENALELSVEIGDTFNISNCYFKLGLAHYKKGNNESATNYFKESIRLNRSTPEDLKKSYIYLAMVYASADPNKQNYYLAKYDSISSNENKRKTEELLIKFETSEKEKEIERLKTKEIKNELIIQKNKFNIILIASGLLFSLLIIVILVYRHRTRKKILKQHIEIEKNKVEQVKIELNRKNTELALMIDDLKENIVIMNGLKKQITEISNDELYINTIVSSLEQKYVSDKHWDNIIHHFSALHKEHIPDLKSKSENISRNDIKLSILMKLDYTNSGMSEILNISLEGVKKAKQRLKKKLENNE